MIIIAKHHGLLVSFEDSHQNTVGNAMLRVSAAARAHLNTANSIFGSTLQGERSSGMLSLCHVEYFECGVTGPAAEHTTFHPHA